MDQKFHVIILGYTESKPSLGYMRSMSKRGERSCAQSQHFAGRDRLFSELETSSVYVSSSRPARAAC